MKRILCAGAAAGLLFASQASGQSFGGPPYYNGSLGVGSYYFGGSLAGDPNLGGNFDRANNVSVLERPHPDYAPLGIREGQFLILPSVTTGLRYDDNIYAENTDKQSDGIFNIKGHVEVDSQFAVNVLNIYADVLRQQYFQHDSESATTYDIGTYGRYEVNRFSFFDGGASFEHEIEPRSAVTGNLAAVEPIRYDIASTYGQFTQDFDRLRLRGGFNYDYVNYNNDVTPTGAQVFEAYRNHSDVIGHIEADYALSPNTSIYVIGRVNDQLYDLSPPTVPDNRNNSGEEIDVGGDIDLSRLVRGRLEVGYFSQDFKDPASGTVSGPTVRGRIEYFPTQLTTVTLAATRNFADSGIIQAPAYLDSNVSLRVDHELLRNVILTAQAGYENADFEGIPRTDNRFIIYAGGTYLLNRRLGVRVLYNFLRQDSTGSQRSVDFSDNSVTASLVLSY